MTERALEPPQTAGAVPGRAVSAPAARSLVALPAAGHELLAVAGRRVPAMQATLEVGPVDDPLEREADRVAERVMRMPEPGTVRRKCACGGEPGPDGECARCRAKRLGLQLKPAAGAIATVAPPIVHDALGSPGAPLEPATRAFFQPRLGADLSHVRVHRDDRAAASARAVGALAYTVGSDIVFAAGSYAPTTHDGRKLLAHELAHVLQQRTTTSLQRQVPPITPTCNAVPYQPGLTPCCDDRVISGPAPPAGTQCQDRTTRDNEYDGCSVPDFLVGPGENKDNPGGAYDTWFSDPSIHGTQIRDFEPKLPCDVHDKCFQTCGADRAACNAELFRAARAVCNNSRQRGRALQKCIDAVELAEKLLPAGSIGPFNDRQEEYCVCCPPGLGRLTATTSIWFASGRAELDAAAEVAVTDFVDRYRAALTGNCEVTLVGHASPLGSDADNQTLSDERVKNVRAAIQSRLAPASVMWMFGRPLGEQLGDLERPEDPTDDCQEYRTVEIILVAK